MPKASALRFHQSNGSRPNGAPLALRKHSRVLRHRRAPADCFGANPVASALGNPTRRDPGGVMRTYHEGRPAALNTGTFYFGGNRNFLLWSDMALVTLRDGAAVEAKWVRTLGASFQAAVRMAFGTGSACPWLQARRPALRFLARRSRDRKSV